MVTTQQFPSHKEAMTFSYAARSGTVVDAPTPSFFFQARSPTKLQFIFLSMCLSFFLRLLSGRSALLQKLVLNSLVSVISHLVNYFNNHKRLILLLVGRFFCLRVLGGFLV